MQICWWIILYFESQNNRSLVFFFFLEIDLHYDNIYIFLLVSCSLKTFIERCI